MCGLLVRAHASAQNKSFIAPRRDGLPVPSGGSISIFKIAGVCLICVTRSIANLHEFPKAKYVIQLRFACVQSKVLTHSGASEGTSAMTSSMHMSRALHADAYEAGADETLLAAAALCAVTR